jgi:hypothetical protein
MRRRLRLRKPVVTLHERATDGRRARRRRTAELARRKLVDYAALMVRQYERAPPSSREKYCHNGGTAFPGRFSQGAISAPFRTPGCALKPHRQAVSGREGAINSLLWGRGWTRVLFFFRSARSTATTRARPFPPAPRLDVGRRQLLGVHDRHQWHPLRHPEKVLICRVNSPGCQDPRPLGADIGASGFFTRASTATQRGHGLRPPLRVL